MQGESVQNSNRVRLRPFRSEGESRQLRRVQTRKVSYRVGYNWNKGGRLKELRIRHLARKFLKIWMHNTFGRVLPLQARSHYSRGLLSRAFETWRDDWWTSRREWSLLMRAECHYRYYLLNLAFYGWRNFTSLQKQKKTKLQYAQSLANRRLVRLALDRWKVFIEIRRGHWRMLESFLERKRLSDLHSVWNLWQTRLQKQQHHMMLEDQAQKQRALSLQSKAWSLWKETHRSASYQKEEESKAALYFTVRLKTRAFCRWMSFTSHQKTKKDTQAVAQRACRLRLVRRYWREWRKALSHKQNEERRLRVANRLAVQSTRRRVLVHWKAYVQLCREEAERNQTACQHFQHHLLRAGLRGLSLNVSWNKAHRLNNNMAIQHRQQTMLVKYWRLWTDRLEEVEDQSFQPLIDKALNIYRVSVLRRCFHHWRETLAEQIHTQEVECRADVWFAERTLPRCFQSWVEFTLQGQLREQRRFKAEAFNRKRQFAWVFHTWWERSEKHKEEKLSERMAVLHDEQRCARGAWLRWRGRTQQQIREAERQEASHRLHTHRLLHNTLVQWRNHSSEIRDRRTRELQACLQGDLRRLRWAVEKWKKFVQKRRVKKSRLKEIQGHYEAKLLKQSFVALENHRFEMSLMCECAKELQQQRTQIFLRKSLTAWREKAELLAEVRLAEQQAREHFQQSVQQKVFHAWREVTRRALLKRHQQRELLRQAQKTLNEARLRLIFKQWRERTTEARTLRINMEKARRHHNSKLLSTTLNAWSNYHCQHQRHKVMKRQGLLLLRLKMYQKFFERWKTKLQHRRREAKQTERALWHWSLTLQAKVLQGWRLWVTEQRSKRKHAARAAQVYRDQLLREGVTCILTYAAHMNDLTASLTQLSQEQRSQRLQRVVRRCAMRWKRRALGKSQKEQDVRAQPQKKSVTFCSPGPGGVSTPHSAEQEAEALSSHTEAALKPSQTGFMSGAESPLESRTQDLLLPPSAFMTSKTQKSLDSSGLRENPFVSLREFETCSTHPPAGFQDPNLKNSPEKEASVLMRELLTIRTDMKNFQQSKKQLRAWCKLRDVLQSWLQTSAEDEQVEKSAVCEELKELEKRIQELSTELEKQKPTILLHVERIQHLQSVLSTAGVYPLC
ncbi:protein SFI1 homolog isoform X1 [Poecilia formosa]|uniref:SFI1 centrin binding protein n=1 Tax=Poecilia formosa TaxID=48698 RepID=A0A087YJL4_POEFO|nr:PREDICTED: protein SFI1 homolog isoform X1 [Poecilia formosa]